MEWMVERSELQDIRKLVDTAHKPGFPSPSWLNNFQTLTTATGTKHHGVVNRNIIFKWNILILSSKEIWWNQISFSTSTKIPELCHKTCCILHTNKYFFPTIKHKNRPIVSYCQQMCPATDTLISNILWGQSIIMPRQRWHTWTCVDLGQENIWKDAENISFVSLA